MWEHLAAAPKSKPKRELLVRGELGGTGGQVWFGLVFTDTPMNIQTFAEHMLL